MTVAENWRTRNCAGLATRSPGTSWSSARVELVWLTGTVNWEKENNNWDHFMNKRGGRERGTPNLLSMIKY